MGHYKIKSTCVLFLGIITLTSPCILANKENHTLASGGDARCKTSLKRFCLQLETWSKQRENPAYYESLYRQSQDFLNTLEALPSSSVQTDKCENFLKTIQDIVGAHGLAADSTPMPDSPASQEGKLTQGVLETTPKKPLYKSIRYVYDDPASQRSIETAEEAEETKEADGFPSRPTSRLSSTRKSSHALTEKDE